jgi:uncharacterized MAPEG superfamily protein
MTVELWYLFLCSVLLAVLWIPYIIGQVMTHGPLTPIDYAEGRDKPVPHWVRRANRAHINLVEQFGAFAGLVLVAHLAQISNGVTQWCAILFFWFRIAHAVVYMVGVKTAMARTLIFTGAWICLIVLAFQIFASS